MSGRGEEKAKEMMARNSIEQVPLALDMVYRDWRYRGAALLLGVLSTLVFGWAAQLVTYFPGSGLFWDVTPLRLVQVLVVAFSLGLLVPMQVYVFGKGRRTREQAGAGEQRFGQGGLGALRRAIVTKLGGGVGGVGLALGVACLTCCAPLILPAVLAFFGMSGGLILSLNVHLVRWSGLLFLGSLLLSGVTLLLLSHNVTAPCALPHVQSTEETPDRFSLPKREQITISTNRMATTSHPERKRTNMQRFISTKPISRKILVLTISLVVISTLLFITGVIIERSGVTVSAPSTSQQQTTQGSNPSHDADGGHESTTPTDVSHGSVPDAMLFGLDLENPWVVGAFAFVWLVLIAALVRFGRSAFLAILLAAIITTVLDVGEVLRKAGEANTLVLTFAVLVAVAHLALVAVALLVLLPSVRWRTVQPV